MTTKYIENKIINGLFELLNTNNIQYVVIKNILDELPNKLPNGKDIDIIVKKEQKEKFNEIMKKSGYHIQTHPLGRENGWLFLYGLEEYQFWKLENYNQDFLIDVSFKLSCKGLMPKTWIPLDHMIQKRVWENKVWDEVKQWWIMDLNTRFVYYLVRCIFDKKVFSEKYVQEIERVKNMISKDIVKDMLLLIFYGYTERLMDLVDRKCYHKIIKDYITFKEY